MPQGSVLTACLILFNTFINNAINCSILLFVHNTVIYIAGTDINNIVVDLNKELEIIANWLDANQLKLKNVEKISKYMIENGTRCT